MREPIRVLHFADVHLGIEHYGRLNPEYGLNSRIVDISDRMKEMIADAGQRQVDLILFAGDAFKNRTPNPTVQRIFARRIQQLAEIAPVVMIVGNHDVPTVAQRASSLDIYQTLNVPNVHVAHDWDLIPVETNRGRVQIATAPYPLRDSIIDMLEAAQADDPEASREIGDFERKTVEMMHVGLRDLARRAAESDDPRILMGHFTVSGAQFGSEREMTMGSDPAVQLSEIADPTWDYVALGHIHNHQNLTARLNHINDTNKTGNFPHVVYSGSLERVTFNEESDRKGYVMVDLNRTGTTYEFVPVTARKFRTIRADLRESADPMADLLTHIETQDLADSVVRVVVQATHENERHLRDTDIHDAIRGRGASYMAGVQKEVERPTRSRVGEDRRIDTMNNTELLTTWLAARQTTDERKRLLLDAAVELMSEG